MRLLTFVLILAAVLALGWAWLFGPYWIDYFKMKTIVGTAALSWSAYDMERGKRELAHLLRAEHIPEYLTPDACKFYEAKINQEKTVDCAWTVEVAMPLHLEPRRLHFSIIEVVNAEARVEER